MQKQNKSNKMSEHDFKLNVDSLIDRLLEGECNIGNQRPWVDRMDGNTMRARNGTANMNWNLTVVYLLLSFIALKSK